MSATSIRAAVAVAGMVVLTGAASDAVEAKDAAVDAYIFGYPLVTMEMSRRAFTNVSHAGEWQAPMGQLAKMRTYPKPENKEVTTPNADTLYNFAWVDLSAEPYLLSIPEMHGRYFMFPMLDAWTNVFQSPGSRTTGTAAQKYLITGPDWKGSADDVPSGVTRYQAPTNLVWIMGRIYSSGSETDLAEVHRLQDQLSLVPLSQLDKSYTPPPGEVDRSIDSTTSVRDQVDALDARSFFALLAEAMAKNPPAEADAPMMAKLAELGIVPGRPFDGSKLPESALADVPAKARRMIGEHLTSTGKVVNGWRIQLEGVGTYGTDYLQRATITALGLGANLPEDAVYLLSQTSADGEPYDGANAYVLRFGKGQFPPVRGFWSLTMYDEQMFFVPNELDRFTRSSRNDFVTNADGSVDLYIQKESPGADKETNWLPAPAGKFRLLLRLYWPNDTPPTILDGSWEPPGAQLRSETW